MEKAFDKYHREINKWHNYHKSTSPGTTTLLKKRFHEYEFEYQKLLAEYRQTKKQSFLKKAEDLLKKADNEFEKFKRLEVIGALSK